MYQKIFDNLLKKLILKQDEGEDKDEVKNFEVNTSSMFGQATFVKIKQPLDFADQIFLQPFQFINLGCYILNSLNLSAHQIDSTCKIMLVELLFVLI